MSCLSCQKWGLWWFWWHDGHIFVGSHRSNENFYPELDSEKEPIIIPVFTESKPPGFSLEPATISPLICLSEVYK